MDTHLNCINKSMQFNAIQMSTHNICLYKEVKKKYTGCNLKTTEFLDCALIGVCAVIRSNMYFICAHFYTLHLKMNWGTAFHTRLHVHPVKTWISQGICTLRVSKDPKHED